jgi:signal peptidase I
MKVLGAIALLVIVLLAMSLLKFLTPTPQHERYKASNPVLEETDESHFDVAKRDYPDGGYKIYQVAPTGSMQPTMDGGDYVIAVKMPYEDLKEGDIINYTPKWNNGGLVVHRLVQKDKGGWIASGDANKRSESWERVTPETYRDKAVKIVRKPKKAK